MADARRVLVARVAEDGALRGTFARRLERLDFQLLDVKGQLGHRDLPGEE
jgi:hypothetical protein